MRYKHKFVLPFGFHHPYKETGERSFTVATTDFDYNLSTTTYDIYEHYKII